MKPKESVHEQEHEAIAEEMHHKPGDNPPDLEQAVRDAIAQAEFTNTGYVQQSDKFTFIRLKAFDATVTIDGEQYPCKVDLSLRMPNEQEPVGA